MGQRNSKQLLDRETANNCLKERQQTVVRQRNMEHLSGRENGGAQREESHHGREGVPVASKQLLDRETWNTCQAEKTAARREKRATMVERVHLLPLGLAGTIGIAEDHSGDHRCKHPRQIAERVSY